MQISFDNLYTKLLQYYYTAFLYFLASRLIQKREK